jgi:hypothetical protein
MPYRNREAPGGKQAARHDNAIRAAAVTRQPPGRARPQVQSSDDPGAAKADALASHHCASRVAIALKSFGYGFALIPSSAKPKPK